MAQPTGSGSGPPPAGAGRYRLLARVARALVLVAAALGLVIYLLGFVGEVSVTSSFGGPMLVGGGLLAGVAVLPRVGRVLAPAAVLTGTGALFLLQLAIGIGWPPVVLVATGLAFVQTAAVVGALLLDNGLVADRAGLPPYAPAPVSARPVTGRSSTGCPAPVRPPGTRRQSGPAPACARTRATRTSWTWSTRRRWTPPRVSVAPDRRARAICMAGTGAPSRDRRDPTSRTDRRPVPALL